jgi:cell division protein FtsQ
MDRGGRDMPALNAPPPRTVRRQPNRHAGAVKWAKRGVKLALVAAVAWCGYAGWHSGRLAIMAEDVSARFIALSVAGGFRIENVQVIGREQTDPKALLAAAGLKRGDAILAVSPEVVRQRIESMSWVASAAVERRLPDTVTITIVERKPIALWQHNDKFALIDAKGDNLGPVSDASASALPLIVGGDAPMHASALLSMLATHPDLSKRVQASNWIGSRRWDLRLDNGIEVKLPEDGVAEALQQLADAEASSRILERDVAVIDLRLSGKMIVRLAHELPAPPAKPKAQQGI